MATTLLILYDGGTIAAAANYTSRFTISGDGDAQFDTSSAPPVYTNEFPDGGISVDVKYPDLLGDGSFLEIFFIG